MNINLFSLICICPIVLDTCLCGDDLQGTSNDLPQSYSDADSLVKEGEVRFKEFSLRANSYGDCWEKAVTDLRMGCKQLNEDVQRRLALSFANCFLQKSGSEVRACPENKPVAECLRNASERVFSTYTEFFTHTQSICYFLEHKLWQSQTEDTILKLSKNSVKVSKQLDESQKSTSSMLKLQQLAYEKQQQLIDNSVSLNVELEKSRSNAKNIFEDFRATTQEQRMMIFEIFDRIKRLQSVVLGEFTGVYTFIFYLISVIIAYLLTSTPRTTEARFWLLLVVTANAVLERIITVYSIDEETEKSVLLDANGPIYYRVWMCRKASSIVAGCVLVWFASRYRDYNAINNKLLMEIKKQNWEMQNFIKSIKTSPHRETPASVSPEEKQGEPKEATLNSSVNPATPENSNKKEPLAGLPVNVIVNTKNGLPSRSAEKNQKSKKKEVQVAKLKSPVSKRTPKGASLSENLKINITSPSDQIEVNFSPSGRYNLRQRSTPVKSGSDAETGSPQTLSRRVKKAARESFENRQEIKKASLLKSAKKSTSFDDI